MSVKSDIDFTYMGHLHKVCYKGDLADEQHIYAMLKKFRQLSNFAFQVMPVFFAIDYSKRKYLFWTDSTNLLAGYHAREMVDGGLDMTLDVLQKDFFKTYNEKVFPATLNFLKNIPKHEHADHIVSFNHRMKNASGKFADIYQRCIYISAEGTDLPVYCLGMGIDITAIKKDTLMLHTIEKADKATGINTVLSNNYFYPFEEDKILSQQEKLVLKWLSDGLSSKMIAHKMKISENTVANHRQNMMRKTNTNNVAQLVVFGVKNQLV